MSCSPNLQHTVTMFVYRIVANSGMCEACATSCALNLAFTLYRDLLDMVDKNEQETDVRREADIILSRTIELFTQMRAEPDLMKRRAIMQQHAEGMVMASSNGTSERVN